MAFVQTIAHRALRRGVVAVVAGLMLLGGCSPYAHRAEIEALSTATQSAGELGDRQRDWEIAQRTRDIDHVLGLVFDTSEMAQRHPPVFTFATGCQILDATLDFPPPVSNDAGPCTVVLSRAEQHALPDPSVQPAPVSPADQADQVAEAAALLPGARTSANARIEAPLLYTNDRYQADSTSAGQRFTLTPADQFEALKQYASGLMALTEASDVEALQKAQGEVATSLAGVMQAVGPDGEAQQRSELGTALGSGFGLLQRTYLNRQRLRALRRTVVQSDTSFTAVTNGASLYVQAVQDAQEDAAQIALENARNAVNAEVRAGALDRAGYLAHYHELDTKARAFGELKATDITAAFAALADAHRKLAEALNDRSSDWVEVSGFVYEFATAVETLNTAVDAFEPDEEENSNAAAAQGGSQ